MANSVSTPLTPAKPAEKSAAKSVAALSPAGRANAAGQPAPTIILTVISNPRVEMLFYSLVHRFETVSFQPLSLEDLLPPAEPRPRPGHLRAAGLLVDEASLGLPGVETLAEELPHRVIRQRETVHTEPLPPKWGDVLDMQLPVSQFIGELTAWLQELRQRPEAATQTVSAVAETMKLTERERQILDGLTTGARYVDIADILGLSIDTIRGHLKRAYRKLRVQSRTAAVAAYLGRRPAHTPGARHEVGAETAEGHHGNPA